MQGVSNLMPWQILKASKSDCMSAYISVSLKCYVIFPFPHSQLILRDLILSPAVLL